MKKFFKVFLFILPFLVFGIYVHITNYSKGDGFWKYCGGAYGRDFLDNNKEIGDTIFRRRGFQQDIIVKEIFYDRMIVETFDGKKGRYCFKKH